MHKHFRLHGRRNYANPASMPFGLQRARHLLSRRMRLQSRMVRCQLLCCGNPCAHRYSCPNSYPYDRPERNSDPHNYGNAGRMRL